MNARGPNVHAVVWRASDGDVPVSLVEALDRQGIGHEHAAGPLDAFSRLLASRNRGARGRVLVLVEPERLTDHETIRRALERFDPDARSWAYRATQSPRLAPMAPLPVPEKAPDVVVRAGAGRSGGGDGPGGSTPAESGPVSAPPSLKLAGEGGQTPRPTGPDEDAEQQAPRSVLTPEELEMLLADQGG
ncbi:MAG: hypothetical protein ACF8R9_03530 [Phycisphaerales bacterium JB054]